MAKIIAVFIAYNSQKTLKEFYKNFPKELFDDIILVDDASKDKTYEISKKLGIRSYRNKINLGYGGNIKKAIFIALGLGADIIVDIHPDGEYLTNAIPLAISKIKNGSEFVLGNRFTQVDNPLKNGMYFWKLIPIIFLNWISKIILRAGIDDYHQGFRVYTRNMLEKINFEDNSNNYLFSFELIAQAVFNKIKISQVSVETKYTGKKRGASLKDSIKYSLGVFKILFLFLLAKLKYNNQLFRIQKTSLQSRIKRYEN